MKILFTLFALLLNLQSDATRLFREADSLYLAGKLDKAMEAAASAEMAAEASADTTNLIKALCLRADISIERGDDLDAVDCYNRCADLFPYSEPMFMLSSSLYNIATIYYQSGDFGKAEEYIDKSIKVDSRRESDSILALRFLLAAQVSYEMGDYDKAMELADRGRAYASSRRNYNVDARLMLVQVKCHEALSGPDPDWKSLSEEYLSAYRVLNTKAPGVFYGNINPYAPEFLYHIGMAMDAQGLDARQYFEEAVRNTRAPQKMHGMNPLVEIECCKALAELLLKDGDEAGARKYQDRVEALSYVPYVRDMSVRMSLSQIEFIRREKDLEIERQKVHSQYLLFIVLILAAAAVGLLLMYRYQVRQKKLIGEKNAQLVKLGLQKDELIGMLKRSPVAGESGSDVDADLDAIANDTVPFPEIKLSKREVEVLRLCCQGLINKEIAARLGLSVRTVETHKNNIFRKVGVNSTSELVAFAFKSGLSK